MRIRQHVFDDAVTPCGIRIDQPVKQTVALRISNLVLQICFSSCRKLSPSVMSNCASRVFGWSMVG